MLNKCPWSICPLPNRTTELVVSNTPIISLLDTPSKSSEKPGPQTLALCLHKSSRLRAETFRLWGHVQASKAIDSVLPSIRLDKSPDAERTAAAGALRRVAKRCT